MLYIAHLLRETFFESRVRRYLREGSGARAGERGGLFFPPARIVNEAMRKRVVRMWMALLLVGLTIGAGSCGDPASGGGASAVFLVVEGKDLYGTRADVYAAGTSSRVADTTVFVKVKAYAKDPSDNTTLSIYSDVMIDEYQVTYYRTDGNPNVPAPVTIPCSVRVSTTQEASMELIVLTRDAKLQSPLKELAFGGGEGTIMLGAVFKFFGKDLSGNHITADYTLFVIAGDFAPTD